MTKNEYIQDLLMGRMWNRQILDAALIYWHSEIPFAMACVYMNNLEKKLNESDDPRNHD